MEWELWKWALLIGPIMAALALGVLLPNRVHTRTFFVLIALALLLLLRSGDGEPTFWAWPIMLTLVVAVGTAIVRQQGWRARMLLGSAALAALAGTNVLSERLRARHWHAVDGYVDCWPSCDGWHLLGWLLDLGPPFVGCALVALLLVLAAVERLRPIDSRSRSAGRPGAPARRR